MREFTDLAQLPSDLKGGVISIGNFDGVHLGHAQIIRQMLQQAQRLAAPAIVFTFDPHPVRLLRPQHAPPPLTWTDRKARILRELGVDAMIAYPTDQALLDLEARDFFVQIVVESLAARGVVEGENFNFGKGRGGDVRLLEQLCALHRISLQLVAPVQQFGSTVSSSRIRDTLRDGNVQLACKLMARPYRVRGIVTHGAQRGRTIGFPTANLAGIDTLVPGFGVYAGVAHVDGRRYGAAINVGPSPTFEEPAARVEAHLLDFDSAIYGEVLEVDFVERIRDIQKFSTVDALKTQLARDAVWARDRVTAVIEDESAWNP